MEIEDIRKELNQLLENVVEYSSKYSNERPIPSLEVSFVLSKINKMQENLGILRFLLEEKEKASKQRLKEIKRTPVIEEPPSKREEKIELTESTQEERATLELALEQASISKLIDALTLNDRYLYANELFNKDMSAFNELVKTIDNSSSFNEAKQLFSPLGWDDENEHVLSFTSLVERRFS